MNKPINQQTINNKALYLEWKNIEWRKSEDSVKLKHVFIDFENSNLLIYKVRIITIVLL